MKTLLLTLTLLFSIPVLGQDVLRNKNILEMSRSGITSSEIVSRIKNSICDFDTDKADLETLTAAKVDPAVIAAMVKKNTVTSGQGKTSSSDESGLASEVSETLQPDEQTVGKTGNVQAPKIVTVDSPPFTPYSALSKKERKERLKTPAKIRIAAPLTRVMELLIPAIESWGFKIESERENEVVFAKSVIGFPDRYREDLRTEVKYRNRITFYPYESGGLTYLSISAWVDTQNAFLEPARKNLSEDKSFRTKLEDLLHTVKSESEQN